ncbi:unnamed protein product, partial [Discosporangium mesarthrocarpum]
VFVLGQDISGAEDILVAQGKIEEAISMRHNLQEFEEALSLARAHRLPEEEVEAMGDKYFQHLVNTKQEERAAILKEKE